MVDSYRFGNVARFVNDERKNPNCKVENFTVDGENRVFLQALREIKAGEELSFDYGKDFVYKRTTSP
jgi:SET domain-containing protein